MPLALPPPLPISENLQKICTAKLEFHVPDDIILIKDVLKFSVNVIITRKPREFGDISANLQTLI